MKPIVKTILKGVGLALLGLNSDNDPSFSIKCLKCRATRDLEYLFSQRSGDVEVYRSEDYLDAGEMAISLHCNKCSNRITSSTY